MAAAADDGWNPEWDTPETREQQPDISSWEAFFADSMKRTDKAMRDAGIDPRKCVAARRGAAPVHGCARGCAARRA
jgi:hypothetical protein